MNKNQARDVVAAIFKKAGKKVSIRVAKNKIANLYSGNFGKNEELDILFAEGFRLTKTSYYGGCVLRRGMIICVCMGVEKGATLQSFDVLSMTREEADEKDVVDAAHGATYKGIKFKKWEGD